MISRIDPGTEKRWRCCHRVGLEYPPPDVGGHCGHVPRRTWLDAVRGSAVRALRRAVVVRRARGAATSRRSCSTSAPACASYGLRGARARSTAPRCSRTSTGTTCRACRSSRRCTGRAPRSTCTGRARTTGPLGEVFAQMMRPPFFPIRPDQLVGEVRFHDTADDDFPVGLAKVRSRWVRHVGPTLGFRVELERHVGRVHPRPRAGLTIPTTPTTTCRPRCSSSATASTC